VNNPNELKSYNGVKSEATSNVFNEDTKKVKDANNPFVFSDYQKIQNSIINEKNFNRVSSAYRQNKDLAETRNKLQKNYLDKQVNLL